MRVRRLIARLKKMPQNAEVYTSAHDNYEYETAGYTTDVEHIVKADFEDEAERTCTPSEKGSFDDMPKNWVVIRS